MSTLKLENIGHPDAAGNALEFGADGSIVSRGSVSKSGATPSSINICATRAVNSV